MHAFLFYTVNGLLNLVRNLLLEQFQGGQRCIIVGFCFLAFQNQSFLLRFILCNTVIIVFQRRFGPLQVPGRPFQGSLRLGDCGIVVFLRLGLGIGAPLLGGGVLAPRVLNG